MITINQAINDQQIKAVSDFAIKVWHEYFPALLSDDQIDYMCDLFNTVEAINDNILHHAYQYYLVNDDGNTIGYIALQDQNGSLFLSKLYLSKTARGKGIATKMMRFVIDQAIKRGYSSITLTCNKYNQHSLDVYLHYGFTIVDSVESDIGCGYIMDDYIMKKVV